MHDAWRECIGKPYLHGKGGTHTSAFDELNNSILIMGLHDMIATSKKLAKTKATGPAAEAMRRFVAEALPLALAVASLKDKVVKGRAPRAAPALPANPNKIVKTCPCCFRQIAVQQDRVAHHGYERPGDGRQTSSCYGIQFKPLEVSSEGLEWLIGTLGEELSTLRHAYKKRDELVELFVQRGYSVVKIAKGSGDWDREFRYHVARLESSIDALKRQLPRLRKMLAEWKPVP